MEMSLAIQKNHEHELFNIDLRPEKVLINETGQVKI